MRMKIMIGLWTVIVNKIPPIWIVWISSCCSNRAPIDPPSILYQGRKSVSSSDKEDSDCDCDGDEGEDTYADMKTRKEANLNESEFSW